mmetsp:Transcript_42326/g.95264  ORF Transcript_42326/g.95264 Transcript_42326/m.95264 type:complete len:655 (-) Transcript_42326:34-1998(-)
MNALRSFQSYVFGAKSSKSGKAGSSKAGTTPAKPAPGTPTGAPKPAAAEQSAPSQQPPSKAVAEPAAAEQSVPSQQPPSQEVAAPQVASDETATQQSAEVEVTQAAAATVPSEAHELAPPAVEPQQGATAAASTPAVAGTSDPVALLDDDLVWEDGPVTEPAQQLKAAEPPAASAVHQPAYAQPQAQAASAVHQPAYAQPQQLASAVDQPTDAQPPARSLDFTSSPEGDSGADVVIQTDPHTDFGSQSPQLSPEHAQIATPLRWRGDLSNNTTMMEDMERQDKDLGLAELEEECRRIQIRISEAREEKANLRTRLLEVHDKTDQCARELSDVQESLQVFQDVRGQELLEERAKRNAQLKATTADIQRLQAEVVAAREEHAQLGLNSQLVGELRSLQAQVVECKKSERDAASQAFTYSQEVTRLRSELQDMQNADEKNHASLLQMRASLEEAREKALSWQDKYWSDAPFLAATPEDVERAKQHLRERMEAVSHLEAAVQSQRAKLEELKQTPAEEVSNEDSRGSANPHLLDSTLPSITGVPAANPAESTLSAAEVLLLSRRQVPSQRIALAAVEEDNQRLRQRVVDLKDVLHTVPNKAWTAAGDAAGNAHPGEQQQLQTAEGASAKVVVQLKQALHDDLGLLRSLSAKKRSLERS